MPDQAHRIFHDIAGVGDIIIWNQGGCLSVLKKISYLLSVLLVIAGILALQTYYIATPTTFAEADVTTFTVRRLADNPIITHDMEDSLIAETELYGYANKISSGTSGYTGGPHDHTTNNYSTCVLKRL